jgi:hypothetical protein
MKAPVPLLALTATDITRRRGEEVSLRASAFVPGTARKRMPHTESTESTEFARGSSAGLGEVPGGTGSCRVTMKAGHRSALLVGPRERWRDGGAAGGHENFFEATTSRLRSARNPPIGSPDARSREPSVRATAGGNGLRRVCGTAEDPPARRCTYAGRTATRSTARRAACPTRRGLPEMHTRTGILPSGTNTRAQRRTG